MSNIRESGSERLSSTSDAPRWSSITDRDTTPRLDQLGLGTHLTLW